MTQIGRTEDVATALARFAESLEDLQTADDGSIIANNDSAYAGIQMLRLARTLFPTHTSHQNRADGDSFKTAPPVYGGLLPVPVLTEIAALEALLRRSALYAKHTAFVLPSSIIIDGRRMGPPGPAELDLLSTNSNLLPLLRTGRCSVLPQTFRSVFTSDEREIDSITEAPMIQVGDPTFAPLNNRRFRGTVADELVLLHQFVLPYYPSIDSASLAQVATEETDAFEVFMAWFTRRLAQLVKEPSEGDIRDLVEEIDEGVARLHVEATAVSKKSRILRGAAVGGFAVSVGSVPAAALGLPPAMAASVAGIAGAASLRDVLKEHAARRGRLAQLRQSEFFVPYVSGFTSSREV